MSTTLRMTGRRTRPVDGCEGLAAALFQLLRSLGALAPEGARWSILSRAFEPIRVYTATDLLQPLVGSGPVRKSDVPRGALTHRATLTCSAGKAVPLHLSLDFSLAGAPAPGSGLGVELAVDEAVFARVKSPAEHAVALFRALVTGLDLEVARAASSAVSVPLASGRAVRLGFLTLLPERLGPLPELPPGCEVVPLQAAGWILSAHPGLPQPGSVEQATSLAALRFALGARVLLDGPAFPHPSLRPSLQPAPLPSPAEPEAARPATAGDLPSYLRGESPGQPPLPAVAKTPSPPLAAAPALETGTAELSPEILRRVAVPFAGAATSNAPKPRTVALPAAALVSDSAVPAAAVPFDPSARAELPPAAGPQPQSGLTEDIDIGAIARRVLSFGGSAPARPPDAPAPAPVPVPPEGRPGKRLVRFNPQTGEPLPQPIWEDIPLPPPAKK